MYKKICSFLATPALTEVWANSGNNVYTVVTKASYFNCCYWKTSISILHLKSSGKMYSLAFFPLNEMLFKTEKTVLLPDMFLVCLQGIAIYFARPE